MFSHRTLIKHYTPPTCTLEIYGNYFFLWQKSRKIPEQFNFNLHFDDPKLSEDQKISISGDRQDLDLLNEVVNKHIEDILSKNDLNEDKNDNENENQLITNNIYLSDKGLLNQELTYISKDNNSEKKVSLTKLQLFDLENALNLYNSDILTINNKQEKSHHNIITIASLLTLALASVGIYQYQKQHNTVIVKENPSENINQNQQKLPLSLETEVSPPTPLKANQIMPIPNLKVPEKLRNTPELPPPNLIPQEPPNGQNNVNRNNQAAASFEQNQQTTNIIIPPPPTTPSNVNQQNESNSNLIAINPSSEVTSIPTPPLNQTPRLNSLPTLQPKASLPTEKTDIVSTFNDQSNISTENIKNIPSQFNSSIETTEKINLLKKSNVKSDVKKYFQEKWQPPENLTQSIEYRLLINNDGALERVTPIGQTSTTFLDKTGMPLMGTIIASNSSETQSTVRLILRANGDVETFIESNN